MKKLALLVSGIAFLFMSCNSDDDGSGSDLIIGTWKFVKSSINGVEDQLETCDTEGTWIFSANGDYSELYYEEESGSCVLDDSYDGIWTNINNVYNVTIEGDTSQIQVTFEDNRFYIEYSLMSTGPDPTLDTYKFVYEKQ